LWYLLSNDRNISNLTIEIESEDINNDASSVIDCQSKHGSIDKHTDDVSDKYWKTLIMI
jgi:hypothetical protein